MDRRAFLRLVGIGLAAGPAAMQEAMTPRIFYSIPASLGTSNPFDYGFAGLDEAFRRVYEAQIYELYEAA